MTIFDDITAERLSPTPERIGERRTTLAELVEEADDAALLHLEQQLGVTLIALPQGDARWTAPVVGQHGPISACTWSWAPRGRGRPSKGRQRTLVALDPEVLASAKVAAAAAGESLADLVEGAVVAELARRETR